MIHLVLTIQKKKKQSLTDQQSKVEFQIYNYTVVQR